MDLIPSVAAPHGGNAVVQFEITVRAESGEAFGTVDCEAAFETMEGWHATKMELIAPTPNTAAFRAALLGMDAKVMRTATIG